MSTPAHATTHDPPAHLEPMPPGIQNAYYFEVFNTMSWSVVLGAPMMLLFQHLHATATVIAIAAALNPFLNILQMPAARFVERVGYRRFVLAGWTSRSFMILGMMIVASLVDVGPKPILCVVMLVLLFCFNTLRGISACGILPWFTHIVPAARRGEFLARQQTGSAFSQIVSLVLFGLLLHADHGWYSFALLYLISFIAATSSLQFLRRVPDVPVEKITSSVQSIPWKEMFFYAPFYRYIRLIILVNTAFGASGAFWVRFFKTHLQLKDSDVLYIASGTMLVAILTLMLAAPIIDRAHNKLVLTIAGLFFCVHFAGWGSVAAGFVPFNWTMVIIQAITSGMGSALWNLANVRMVMGIVPEMGRPHFLALYSVAANLTAGVIPLFWGPIIDRLHLWHATWGTWTWNSYSVLYAALMVTMVLGVALLQTLEEPKKMTWDVFMKELLVNSPSRAVSRVIGRLRGPTNL